MENEVKLVCKACGWETMRELKPEPKNAREGNQVLFHCKGCGVVNLRDGSVRGKKKPLGNQEDPEKDLEEKGKEEKPVSGSFLPFVFAVISAVVVLFVGKSIKGQENKTIGNQGTQPPIQKGPFDFPY